MYLKNRSPTIAVTGITPEEAWSGGKVDLKFLRVFGCKAFMHIPDVKRKKLDPKSLELVFVGYCENTKGYRLIDSSTGKLYKAKDVVFLESSTVDRVNKESKSTEVFVPSQQKTNSDIYTPSQNMHVSREIATAETIPTVSGEISTFPDTEERNIEQREVFYDCDSEPQFDEGNTRNIHLSDLEISERRYPLRDRKAKIYEDYIMYYADEEREDPHTIEEALSREDHEDWRKAIQSELNAIKKNCTWTLVESNGGNFVDSKWIFKIKKEPGGKTRYKARLVARGFTQTKGINYNETFAPVVRHSTLRLLFALAAELNLKIDHMDVITAFLNGELLEKVYMKQPKGFEEKGKENHVCLLNKALYGLKQAPRAWYDKLNKALIELGFKRSENEPCIYIRKRESSLMFIAVYVDDLLIFWNNESEISFLKNKLKMKFEMKDLGEADTFLGIKIESKNGVISINQTEYTNKVLKRFNMSDCKKVSTPLECKLKLEKSEITSNELPYRELIGSLMYLAVCSRPDIAHAVSYLSQFNNCYNYTHWAAAKRVLRYLSGTKTFSLIFRRTGKPLYGYVDADHGGDVCDRKSYSGYAFILAGGAISWESRKQKTVALSSAEAEYVALSEACREAVFLRRVYTELSGKTLIVKLLSDSQSAIKITQNPVMHQRTKHIDVRHHFVRDMVCSGDVCLEYLSTQDMMADILTKGLCREKHKYCVRGLGGECAS